MKSFFLLLILLSTGSLFGQAEFLDTLTTASTPFQLPWRVDATGKVSFLETPSEIMFGPAFGAAYTKNVVQFINPVKIGDDLGLMPISENRGWIEIRRRRYDGGLGVVMVIGSNFNAGLIPFKGAMQTIVKVKGYKEEIIPNDLSMPQDLKQVESWRVGDQGTYQVYGGVEAMLTFGVSIINLAKTSVAFQNQFIVEIKKVTSKYVVFSVAEEKLQRSESSIGPLVSKGSLQLFRGQRFSSEFVLDLTNPQHHELFQQGLKGKLNLLQASLDHRMQRLKWLGSSSSFYLGIPFLIGVDKGQGRYKINLNGDEADMSVKTRQSRGVFATPGEHNRLVMRTNDVVLLLWNSQMSKARDHVMEKYFFRFGRSIGIKGFNREMPRGVYGSILTQIGVTFLKDEMIALQNVDPEKLNEELRQRCEGLNLNCKKESRRRDLLKSFAKSLRGNWDDMTFELGKLLMKNPVMIHSLVKVANLKKSVYVKFLNDNYQSVEGLVAIEP